MDWGHFTSVSSVNTRNEVFSTKKSMLQFPTQFFMCPTTGHSCSLGGCLLVAAYDPGCIPVQNAFQWDLSREIALFRSLVFFQNPIGGAQEHRYTESLMLADTCMVVGAGGQA
jgi:hypothetical protein